MRTQTSLKTTEAAVEIVTATANDAQERALKVEWEQEAAAEAHMGNARVEEVHTAASRTTVLHQRAEEDRKDWGFHTPGLVQAEERRRMNLGPQVLSSTRVHEGHHLSQDH